MQDSNLRPQSYEPCALPTTPMCNVVVIDRIELSTSMLSAWCSTVELYHSTSGHTVTIRVLLLKRQEHHLNALAGDFPAFLSKSIIFISTSFVEVAGFEPTCNQLRFQHGITPTSRGDTPRDDSPSTWIQTRNLPLRKRLLFQLSYGRRTNF